MNPRMFPVTNTSPFVFVNRYCSKLEKRIVTAFLSLIPVVKATCKDLFETLHGELPKEVWP